MSNDYTTGAGWTCAACLAWVPSGTTHHCPSQAWAGRHSTADSLLIENMNFLTDTRGIEGCLARIANSLEALVEVLHDIYGPPVREDG